MSLCRLPKYLTLEETAKYLKLSSKTLARRANAGEVPCRKIGRKFYFSPVALEEWFAKMDTDSTKDGVGVMKGEDV